MHVLKRTGALSLEAGWFASWFDEPFWRPMPAGVPERDMYSQVWTSHALGADLIFLGLREEESTIRSGSSQDGASTGHSIPLRPRPSAAPMGAARYDARRSRPGRSMMSGPISLGAAWPTTPPTIASRRAASTGPRTALAA